MFDLNEIRKQAQQAKEQALDAVKETMEKTRNESMKSKFPALKKARLYLPLKLKNSALLILNVRWKFLDRYLV